MGLVSPVSPVEYKGDGTTKRFSFPFPYDDKKDIVVQLHSHGAWETQFEGGSYRFINDNTIEFKFAPKQPTGVYSEWNAVKISRRTYARKAIANKFKESRPECAVVDNDCRGEYDGTDGILTDDRDESARPFKVGDTITYSSPCDEGANIYWYATPREGLSGSTTLIRTDYLRGRNENDKITSLKLDESHIDKRISIKIKCIGCGPPDGLCCEWTVNTDNDVLKDDVCGLNAVIGSTASKILHNIKSGYGVIRLTLTSPDVGRTFTVTFPNGDSTNYIVGGGNTPSAEHVIPKPDDSAYVIITVPDVSGKGWQYSIRCTEAVDTSKYRYCRWVGNIKAYYGGRWSGGSWGWGERVWIPGADYTEEAQSTWHYPRKSSWLEYNPGTKTDGYASINGPGIATWSSWSYTVGNWGPFYFGDAPWDNEYNYEVVPWRSSMTVFGTHNGLGIYFGALSLNNKGTVNGAPQPRGENQTYLVFYSLAKDSYQTVAGYWEFSNDASDPYNKVVEASWDGHRGDAWSTGWPPEIGEAGYTTVDDSYMPNLTDID